MILLVNDNACNGRSGMHPRGTSSSPRGVHRVPRARRTVRTTGELPFEKRGKWMAEWLLLASRTDESEGRVDGTKAEVYDCKT